MRNRNGIKLLAVLTAVTISFPIQSSAGEWRQNGDQWQYILEDGREQRNSWLKTDDGKWYHFDENGVMRTGWYQDQDQKWYYLEADGFMASGWKQIDGKWYYLEADGSMASGWKEIDGKWILETMVSDMAGVGRFVIGLADEIEIIDSPALRDYIRQFVTQNLLPYGSL